MKKENKLNPLLPLAVVLTALSFGIILLLRKGKYMLRGEDLATAVLSFIIDKNEGGYVSAERAKQIGDSGGETKFGIAKKFHPSVDIAKLTKEDAIAIYLKEYYAPLRDSLAKVDDEQTFYQALDHAINAGVSRSKGLLAMTTNSAEFKALRLKQYATFKGWQNLDFKKAWTDRTNRLYA